MSFGARWWFGARAGKPKVRKATGGSARAQLKERDPQRGVKPLGAGHERGFMTRRQHQAAKKVWP